MTDPEQLLANETPEEIPPKSIVPEDYSGVYLSLNEASRQTKVPKGTISKDATKGKIQWHERPDGTRKLHAAEVFHFYGDRIKRAETGNTIRNSVSVTTPEQQPQPQETGKQAQIAFQLAEANAEIRHLRERLDDKAEQIEDLRLSRDAALEQTKILTRLLNAPAAEPVKAELPPLPSPPWWQRFFSPKK